MKRPFILPYFLLFCYVTILQVPGQERLFSHAGGFLECCCQFEFVATHRYLIPRRPAACEIKSNLSGPSVHLSYEERLIVNMLLCVSGRRRWCARLGRCRTRRSSCGRTRCPSGRVPHRSYRCDRWSATCR